MKWNSTKYSSFLALFPAFILSKNQTKVNKETRKYDSVELIESLKNDWYFHFRAHSKIYTTTLVFNLVRNLIDFLQKKTTNKL